MRGAKRKHRQQQPNLSPCISDTAEIHVTSPGTTAWFKGRCARVQTQPLAKRQACVCLGTDARPRRQSCPTPLRCTHLFIFSRGMRPGRQNRSQKLKKGEEKEEAENQKTRERVGDMDRGRAGRAGKWACVAVFALLLPAAMGFAPGMAGLCRLQPPRPGSCQEPPLPCPARRAPRRRLLRLQNMASGADGGAAEVTARSQASATDASKTAAAAAAAAAAHEKYVLFGWLDLRVLVLVALVVQNACQMLSMRYSRVVAADSLTPYLPSTAVVVSEVLKVAVCLAIIAAKERGNASTLLWRDVVVNWRDTLMVSVPAFVYMVQNNLLYVAASNLDAATCQITYQVKILTTALFAVAMLGKRISLVKWARYEYAL